MGCRPSTIGSRKINITETASDKELAQIKLAIKKNDLILFKKASGPEFLTENFGFSGDNSTCLHLAAEYDSYIILEFILDDIQENIPNKFKAIVNFQNKKKLTPAIIAIRHDHILSFSILLKHNAFDFVTRDSDGKSVKDYINESNYCKEYYNEYTSLSKSNKAPTQEPPKPKPIKVKGANKRTVQPIPEEPDQIFVRINPKFKVHELYKSVKDSNQPYTDPDFPAKIDSITKDTSHKSFETFSKAVWRRPSEFMKSNQNKIKVFDTIEPNDVEQGELGISYFLSCLSCLAEYPTRLCELFTIRDYNQWGVYSLKFHVAGVPTEIVIDDLIPCHGGNPDIPLFSKAKGYELWVMLIEKAWAKLFKQYTATEAGDTERAFEYLTMAPSFTFLTKDYDKEKLLELLSEADKKKWMIACYCSSDDQKKNQNGFLQKEVFSLLDVHNIDGLNLLKLRNPWGKNEISGEYSDNSTKWTNNLKKRVDFVQAEDGMFFLTIDEFKQKYQGVSISCYHDEWYYSYQQTEQAHNHAVYYQFEVKESVYAYIRVHQPDELLMKQTSPNYRCSPAELTVCLLLSNGSLDDVVLNSSEKDTRMYGHYPTVSLRNNSKGMMLRSGRYIIRAKVNWMSKKAEAFTVSLYSSKDIKLQIPQQSFKDYFKRRYLLIGKQNKERTVIKEGVFFSCGWHEDKIFYFWLINEGTKIYESQWSLKSKENLKIKKFGMPIIDNKVNVRLDPGQSDVIIVKKIDLKKKTLINYDYTSNWI